MRGKPSVVLVAGVFTAVLLAGHSRGAAEPGPHPDNDVYAAVPLDGPRRPPPPEWYEAIDVRPVQESLKEEGCYAVIRVERGFQREHTMGRYLVVTLSFREPEVVVQANSLALPEGQAGWPIYVLSYGHRKNRWWPSGERYEKVKDQMRSLLETQTRTFMPDQGPPRFAFGRELNRLGIGHLPSVTCGHPLCGPFPVARFSKEVDEDGRVRWRKVFAGGAIKGSSSPDWRITVAASWESGKKKRESFHEFTVQYPFTISDTRYEQILMQIAPVLRPAQGRGCGETPTAGRMARKARVRDRSRRPAAATGPASASFLRRLSLIRRISVGCSGILIAAYTYHIV